jgi:phosphoadenosine phosphosulfate reductase
MERHSRVALSFSGGKDSLACLYMLRPWLERVRVYHVDTGEMLPEMVEVVRHGQAMAPHFIHIRTDARGWIARNGLPTDLLPFSAHTIGRLAGQEGVRLAQRYDCCWANIMEPAYRAMREDGATMIIRGTRRGDMPTLPVVSGDVVDGVEYFYPLQDWAPQQVLDYLRAEGAPIARLYERQHQAPDCATCSAWMNERRAAYLREHHPALFDEYRARVAAVVGEIAPALDAILAEAKELST